MFPLATTLRRTSDRISETLLLLGDPPFHSHRRSGEAGTGQIPATLHRLRRLGFLIMA